MVESLSMDAGVSPRSGIELPLRGARVFFRFSISPSAAKLFFSFLLASSFSIVAGLCTLACSVVAFWGGEKFDCIRLSDVFPALLEPIFCLCDTIATAYFFAAFIPVALGFIVCARLLFVFFRGNPE